MFHFVSNTDATNKVGVIVSGIGFIASVSSIDAAIKLLAGCIAIAAGLYTIYYTNLKIKKLKENKDSKEIDD